MASVSPLFFFYFEATVVMKGRKDRKSLLQDSDEINQIGPTKQKNAHWVFLIQVRHETACNMNLCLSKICSKHCSGEPGELIEGRRALLHSHTP